MSNAVGLSWCSHERWICSRPVPVSLDTLGGGDETTLRAIVREAKSVRVRSELPPGVHRAKDRQGPSELGESRSESETDAELRVLPSGPLPPNPGEMAASHRLGEIIHELSKVSDFVILDTPPLLEVGDAAAMAAKVDGMLFVVNMGTVRWPMLERVRAQVERFPCRKLGFVVVAAKHSRRSAYRYEYRPDRNAEDVPPMMVSE